MKHVTLLFVVACAATCYFLGFPNRVAGFPGLVQSSQPPAVKFAPCEPQPSPDLEKEKAELLRLHKLDREAHFETNVDKLLETSPEEFITVGRGKIVRQSKADERKRFTEYFRDAKYYEWDDLEEPITHISNDASMAWMIVRTRIRRVQKNADGTEKQENVVYAGIMTYEKRDGRWMRVANVSTVEQPTSDR